jgi:Saxitoxin biosynthesis operon protein SxtJ
MNIIQDIRDEIRSTWKEPSGRDLNLLAVMFLVIPGVIGCYLAFWKGSWNGYVWIVVGLALAFSRLIPPLFRLIYGFWLGFSVVLGYFISRIILTMVFFIVLTPTGLIMRVLGKDPMERKLDPGAPSYWRPREKSDDNSIERYEKQF